LQELLADGFARELEQLRELGDCGRTLSLQRDENRAAAVGKLVYGDDGWPSLGAMLTADWIERSKHWIQTVSLSRARL
jgi:hypothetical protein